jgi:hypothetical protein
VGEGDCLKLVGSLGLLVIALLVGIGTAWSFQRGAPDFDVFFTAWKLVVDGRGASIFGGTPDRFLYAPGFAWLFAPLGWLPRDVALALWCFLKAGALGLFIRSIRDALGGVRQPYSMAFACLSVVFVTRPLLIDFQYGQINVIMLGVAAWALTARFLGGPANRWDFIRWFLLGVVAGTKLILLPLLLVPWVVFAGVSSKRVTFERVGSCAGVLFVLFLPVLTEGFSGFYSLMLSWREALLSRGMPLETHNQSISALLSRAFGIEDFRVIALGSGMTMSPLFRWSAAFVNIFGFIWTLCAGIFLLFWLVMGSKKAPGYWAMIMLSLLIVPSHLVWKPYFIFSAPVAALVFQDAWIKANRVAVPGRWYWQRWCRRYGRVILVSVLFVVLTFSSVDFVGPVVAGRIEAASLFMLAHLLMLFLGFRKYV